MNWFHNLFKKENKNPTIQPDEPWPRMPEVKPPKPEKDISEPVFAIVECMKKYPGRWKTKRVSDTYTTTDLKTGESFTAVRLVGGSGGYYFSAGSRSNLMVTQPKWLTQDEWDLLICEIRDSIDAKYARLRAINKIRQDKERQRVMEIYK